MTEHGFTKGDTLALWLPESAEKHVILTAALQGGWKVVDIDTKINSVPELREALKAASDAGASSLYFFPQKDVDHILLLRKSIPEFFHCNFLSQLFIFKYAFINLFSFFLVDDTAGHYFHSKHFPSLKLFIQCGLQNETGCVNFRELFLPTSSFVEAKKGDVKETDVAYEAITLDGGKVKKTKALTYGEVLTSSNYKFLDKILKKEYAEY